MGEEDEARSEVKVKWVDVSQSHVCEKQFMALNGSSKMWNGFGLIKIQVV